MTPFTLRLITIAVILIVAVFIQLKKRNTLLTILTISILTLPFNITYQLEFLSQYYDPYVLNIRINYLIPTIYWTDVLVSALLLYLLFSRQFKKVLKDRRVIYAFLLAVTYWVLHIAIHPEIITIITLSRLYLYVFTLYLLLRLYKLLEINKILNTYKLWLIITLLTSVGLQLAIGASQMLRGTDLGLQMLGESNLVAGMVSSSFIADMGTVFLRAYGTFPHPNLYGAFFVVVLATISQLLLRKDSNKIFATLSWIIAFLTLIGIAISFSRMAYFGAFVIAVGFILQKYGPTINTKSSFMAIPFAQRLTTFGTSLSERVYLIAISWDMFLQNGAFGVGSGLFVRNITDVVDRSAMVTGENGILLLQPVHNVPMLVLAEHGLVGAIFLFLIVWLLFKSLGITRVRWNWLIIAVLLWFVAVLTLDHFLWSLPQGLVLGGGVVVLISGICQEYRKW